MIIRVSPPVQSAHHNRCLIKPVISSYDADRTQMSAFSLLALDAKKTRITISISARFCHAVRTRNIYIDTVRNWLATSNSNKRFQNNSSRFWAIILIFGRSGTGKAPFGALPFTSSGQKRHYLFHWSPDRNLSYHEQTEAIAFGVIADWERLPSTNIWLWATCYKTPQKSSGFPTGRWESGSGTSTIASVDAQYTDQY